MTIEASGGSGRPVWFTSSYSNGAGGECVECAFAGGGALVRDSKGAEAGVIVVGSDAWRFFVQTVKVGGVAR
ncbi:MULTISPECIES: DUF397 domain-containing protein [Streptomyces]|uniref:DUF397 domain-containing protein n=1 Tax=Streptomyces chartreusis NRRL 3882 TaxID=1079985 RepID=A0A2N9BDY8_STRCX|nr:MULTISPECIES: DUF397 domain-containing protein [Streptomyces]MYS88457.1 DUF397 domain-containing protein [Streptomyces sp. SID5464]SOR81560.1 hypothetical protein SCNRRL3882_5012 [Streptomyces chartreusis NRRL 3882]